MNYPLHLGITEAGGFVTGSVKSAIGLGSLLLDGIGDTIRVSLSDDPVKEVKIGNEILKSLGLRNRGVKIISCPSCARQACLAQDGQDIIFTPLFLNPNDFKISFPILTSFTGSSDKDTLIVSPIPSKRRDPRPIADLTLPVTKPPASVIPKCNG